MRVRETRSLSLLITDGWIQGGQGKEEWQPRVSPGCPTGLSHGCMAKATTSHGNLKAMFGAELPCSEVGLGE